MSFDFQNLIRAEFSHLSTIYFNTAFMGPTPKRTRTRIEKTLGKMSDPSFMAYEWVDFAETLRGRLGGLVNVKADAVSLNSSTSEIISTVARGLKLSGDDEVALIEAEYPSDVLPWLHFHKSRVKFYSRDLLRDPKKLVGTISKNTKVLNLSHVSFQTGDRVDLAILGSALADRGIYLLVDVTQSFGGLNIHQEEFKYIDVLACSPYKWFLSPYGQAFAFWSDRAIADIAPLQVGWMSMPQAPKDLTKYTTELKAGARKFDRGQAPNMLGLNGLDESVALFKEIGISNIEKHNQSLVRHFLDIYPKNRLKLLTSTELKGNILCLKAEGIDSVELQKRLRENNIDVSVREGNLRFSFHLFNQEAEIEKVVEVL